MSGKPNLLLIMCDQLRADVLECYGNSFVQTPNIRRLAESGVCFDRAYSQTPVCVPARHGLIAGVNPFELGLVDNSLSFEDIRHPLPELIRSQGYATYAVGKMHFHPVRKHYGFDRMLLSEEIASHIQDDDYLLYLQENGFGDVIEPHGKRSEHYYVPQQSELPEEHHSTAWTASRTCELIRNNRNRPFFIFSSFIKPHPPFDPCVPYDRMYPESAIPMPVRQESEKHPDDYSIWTQNDYKVNGIDNVSDDDIRKMRSYYYGSVTQIDKQIGVILDTLEETGLRDDTLIILTADHGEMLGDHYAFGKRTYYESSTRIPMIVSWPNQIPQGERREHLSMLQDVYATFIQAAGGALPLESSGKDLTAACQDPNIPSRERIIAEYGQGRAMKFMLRWGDFKYIYHANGERENLFHLGLDPNELHDIADDHREICSSCRQQLVEYYKGYSFQEALDCDSLRSFPYEQPVANGYINQYPAWPQTLIQDT
ncbi:sulfatase-like hydrolase/transferase [Paenibacillus mendelii]|uniref:Sulfatase-like hydrolase/transferase n=1 Tax=Paenibacillus mendelii TaxID=206163 RepID=A0ABV6J6V7_9BACL|nr:sulfatase-like hydrolase/transferase [Paenibacillus mendelii]MCQ6560039.1 sulfatase-like hydrolase/transferase [Paenibacillus mendelii]